MVISSFFSGLAEKHRYCPQLDGNGIKSSRTAATGFYISFSFYKSIGFLFEEMTKLKLYSPRFHSYFMHNFQTQEELDKAKTWIEKYNEFVFLNDDSLDCSLALSMYKLGPSADLTAMGALEHSAKESSDVQATNDVIARLVSTIRELPFYSESLFLAAIPKTTGKTTCLPERIVTAASLQLGKTSLVPSMRWNSKTLSLQGLSVGNKDTALEQSNLIIDAVPGLRGASVVLIDDLYQSGKTMNHVAKKLKAAGASTVYGLTLVKSLGNSDNTGSN